MKSHKLLLIVLGAVFLKQLAWMTFIPLFQTPDEQAHFAQVQNRAELGLDYKSPPNVSRELLLAEDRLGVLRQSNGDNKYTYHPKFNIPYSTTTVGPNEKEISGLPVNDRTNFSINESTDYPPLYYQIGSLFYKLANGGSLFDRVFVVRQVAMLTLIALVTVTYFIGQLLFANEIMAVSLAVLVGFQPMLTFVHSGVTSDSLFNLMFGIFLLMGLRLLNRGLNIVDLTLTGMVIMLSFWTKPQANIMAFILLPLLLFLAFRGRTKILMNYGLLLLVGGLSLLGIYSRLSKGVSLFPETLTGNPVTFSLSRILEHANFTLNHTYREVLPWYWGVFRWLSLGLPGWLRQITNILTLGSFGGLAIYAIRVILSRRFDKQIAGIVFLTFAMIMYFLAITAFDYGFRQAHGFSYGIQGRYFFPVMISQMAIFLVGLTALIPKKFELLTAKSLAIGMVSVNIIVFFWVTGSYFSLTWPTFFIQASQYKPLWLKYPVNLILLGLYLLSALWICLLLLRPTTKKK